MPLILLLHSSHGSLNNSQGSTYLGIADLTKATETRCFFFFFIRDFTASLSTFMLAGKTDHSVASKLIPCSIIVDHSHIRSILGISNIRFCSTKGG